MDFIFIPRVAVPRVFLMSGFTTRGFFLLCRLHSSYLAARLNKVYTLQPHVTLDTYIYIYMSASNFANFLQKHNIHQKSVQKAEWESLARLSRLGL